MSAQPVHPAAPGSPATPDRVTAVPRLMRVVCAVVAGLVLVLLLLVALLLRGSSTGVVSFGSADQWAMGGIGVILAGGILALGRSRVDADVSGIRVQNIAGRHELPWAVVDSVRFERKSPWASLRLITGEEVSLLAVQAVDGERAVVAIDGLRALLAASRRATAPGGPPGLRTGE